MKAWKEVIRPGIYWYTDAQGTPAKLVVTRDNVRHLYSQGKAMLSAGLAIPIVKEHQPSGVPQTAAQLAAKQLENAAGWVRDYRINNGALEGWHDITDAEMSRKITDGTITSTSPKIDPSFVDGDGRTWERCITHHALTLRPRIAQQKPFPSATPKGFDSAALMSLTNLSVGVALSQGRFLKFGKDGWELRDRVLFAVEADQEEAMEAAETPATPEEEEEGIEARDDEAAGYDFAKLLDLLKAKDIHLPPDTNEENLTQHLWVALHALTGPDQTADQAAGMMADQTGAGAGQMTQEQPPMFMSLEKIAKAGDPVKTAMARQLIEGAKQKRLSRIRGIVARSNNKKLEADLMKQEAALALSIRADGGGVHDPMDNTLTLLETAVPDTMAYLTRRATQGTIPGAVEMAQPADAGTGITSERAQELANGLARGAGVQNNGKQ